MSYSGPPHGRGPAPVGPARICSALTLGLGVVIFFLGFAPVGVPDYLRLDARVGYKLTEGLTVALTANQFNVSRLVQTAGRPVERRVFLTLSARF